MNEKPIFSYDEPRFRMSHGGRILVRSLSAVGYIVLAAMTVSALLSDNLGLRYLGGFMILFWLDLFIHAGEARAPLSELPKSGDANLARFLLPKSFRALERSSEASSIKRTDVYLEIASALLSESAVRRGLSRMDVKPEEFEQKLETLLKDSAGAGAMGGVNEDKIREIVALAAENALRSGHRFIEPSDIFSSLPGTEDPYMGRLFGMFSLNSKDISSAIVLSEMSRRRGIGSRLLGGMAPDAERGMRHRVVNRAWTSRPTPILDRFGTDYTDLARSGEVGFMIGHEKEYGELVEGLSRGSKPNVLLVGEAGIGKETMISRLAFDIIKDRVPKALFDRRLVGLDIAKMIAGAGPEEIQARLQEIVREIRIAENIILCLPDIHNLLRTATGNFLSAADALLPVIQSGSFPVIGTTYPKELKSSIEPRSDFASLFEIVRVEEITEDEARRILTLLGVILEKKTGILVGFGAVRASVDLAKKYFRGSKFLPGSAEELLRGGLQKAEEKGKRSLSVEDVVEAAEARTNIPIHTAGKEEAAELLKFEETVHGRLIGQEEAVSAVGNALREYRSGLARKGGPIASFLFVGPTGVGKTELAKLVAEIQFGSRDLLIRFDMTEYQDKKSFERFIGSADGSVRGALTEKVLEKPYSLILLDEFEKAFPDILDLFLQVLDDGRLTDGLGRTVDFQNTIVIATSNAHSDIINSALRDGRGMAESAEYLKAKLTDVFKPELLNRFSKIVIFRDLAPKELARIAEIQLKELSSSIADQGISLKFDPSVAEYVVKAGYDPAFGARPLKRVIDDKVRAALAEKMLKGEIERGAEVMVRAENGELSIGGN